MSSKSLLENHFGTIKKSRFEELATQWEAEKNWKEKSQHIALELLEYLDDNNLTQKAFAEQMGVSPQVINKWLKGQENFTLETINKLESALKRPLIQVVTEAASVEMVIEELDTIKQNYVWDTIPKNTNFTTAKVIPISGSYYAKLQGY